jgi:hypothetical protein
MTLRESTLHLILLGMLSLGFVGFFALRTIWPGLIFAHLAALGIMGFYGCLAGALARKKGRRYWFAFSLGFFVPILVGLVAAMFLAPAAEGRLPLNCGGWFSLLTGLLIVFAYTVIRRKKAVALE